MPGIGIPIIDSLVHPALGQLSRVALPANPYSGFVALTPPQNPLLYLTYGLTLTIASVPAEWTRDFGTPDEYASLAQLACNYTDLTGFQVIQQVAHMTWEPFCYRWDEPLPGIVTVSIAPYVSLNLYWMQT